MKPRCSQRYHKLYRPWSTHFLRGKNSAKGLICPNLKEMKLKML